MTRNLPEPAPQTSAHNDGRRRAHAALDEAFDRTDLHRTTGRITLVVDLNEGGARGAPKFTIEELYKKP